MRNAKSGALNIPVSTVGRSGLPHRGSDRTTEGFVNAFTLNATEMPLGVILDSAPIDVTTARFAQYNGTLRPALFTRDRYSTMCDPINSHTTDTLVQTGECHREAMGLDLN